MITQRLLQPHELAEIVANVKVLGRTLGFQHVGIVDPNLGEDEVKLNVWLQNGYHGEMTYMQRHGTKRSRPNELLPGTRRVISVRMDYLPPSKDAWSILREPTLGYIARYALGRDYHKTMRTRLKTFAAKIAALVSHHGYRVFCDSGPVMEKALARDAGLGWIGKHTNLINRQAGSWFFLGEIFTDLPLPPDTERSANYCGSCSACMEICPTGAIVAPFQLDARRCIAYLTIELRGSIPEKLRPLIGNRIFGCDDCQLVCPWNRYAKVTNEKDFFPRHRLDGTALVALFGWSENDYLRQTEGSALRRLGYERWLRNIAIALGNAPQSSAILNALWQRRESDDECLREHIWWAINAQNTKSHPGAK